MEVSVNPFQIANDIARMTENFVPEDSSIYEECSICYESFNNKSFINECLHPFCYKCITDWTKVKAVCPLCIRPITKILHNIRSQDDYDIEEIVPPKIDVLAEIESDFIFGIDDTDTDSSYGGMESMDADSDADVNYDDNYSFDGEEFEENVSNAFSYLNDNAEYDENEEFHDGDPFAHSIIDETESDDDFKAGNEDNENDSSESEDDRNSFFNTVSDLGVIEEEEEVEEHNCDSNDDDDDEDDDAEEYSESNYFDNFYEDAENDEEEEENLLETFDVSDDTDEEHEESEQSDSDDDDDYYLSDRC